VGITVWSLFRSDTDYFAPSQAPFMVNYRVRNLDRMLVQLRATGVSVEAKVVDDFNGRFTWVVDPEGNKIELWEPKVASECGPSLREAGLDDGLARGRDRSQRPVLARPRPLEAAIPGLAVSGVGGSRAGGAGRAALRSPVA